MISLTTSPSKLAWKKLVAGPHRSARAPDPNGGYYAIHQSGKGSITTYHMHPFLRLGVLETVKDAVEFCQMHYEENINE
jgi:hypothetical protein